MGANYCTHCGEWSKNVPLWAYTAMVGYHYNGNVDRALYNYGRWRETVGDPLGPWELRKWDFGAGNYGMWVVETDQAIVNSFPNEWKQREIDGDSILIRGY